MGVTNILIMRTLGNIIWHFPLFGFVTSFFTFLVGGFFLITISTAIYGQHNAMGVYEFEVLSEVSASLPGDVYYSKNESLESLYNDDFALEITCYKGDGYEYFPDLTNYINEMSEGLGYIKFGDFIKQDIKPGMKSQFSLTYSEEEKCNIIFGVIQDSFSRKLYEIELYCYKINSETAALIINGIKIN